MKDFNSVMESLVLCLSKVVEATKDNNLETFQ